jgi:hypothetical protein
MRVRQMPENKLQFKEIFINDLTAEKISHILFVFPEKV